MALALLAFFILLAFTFELYFVTFHSAIKSRTDVLARLYAFYGRGDQAYAGGANPQLPLALEWINIVITQPVNVVLIVAIVRRHWYRHLLQLVMSSYLAYSVVLYFTVGLVAQHETMPRHTASAYAIYYLPNLPWLLGPLYLGACSVRAIARHLRPPISAVLPAIGPASSPWTSDVHSAAKTSPAGEGVSAWTASA
ncbi:MAG: hypothetical protein JWN95_4143 [Frankiales bacterium]|nr:hypothetical protein [Frankiales bacterium]